MAKSIKLNPDLWKRIEQQSAAAGYSSPEEFVEHLIEEELTPRIPRSDRSRQRSRTPPKRPGLPRMIPASLAALSAIWGVLAVLVFRRFTNRNAVRAAINRIYARLLEIRLYSEEMSLVWRAQKMLIADNLKFLARIAPAVLILAIPFALLYPQLDAIYGTASLEVGHTATVTLSGTSGKLQAPTGIQIETLPVKDPSDHQVSWRIRPLAPIRGTLSITLPGGATLTRTIASGNRTLAPNRRSESSINIDYPRANVTMAGISLPWLNWFLLISAVSGIATATATPARSAAHPAHYR